MTKGDWWFKFEIHTWLNDPKLQRLGRANRDSWLRALLLMRLDGKAILAGTKGELANLLHLTFDEFENFISDITLTQTADVTLRNDLVTLKSRRYARELKSKNDTKLRVRKHRSNADVTDTKQDRVISKKLEVKKEKKKDIAEAAISDHTKGMQILQKVIGKYPDGGGQGKALKWMLDNGATLERIERELKAQHAEYTAKGIRASYLSLQKTIFAEKGESPPGDIMARDYPGADHVPFDVVMPLTYCESRERYLEIRDEWLGRNERYKDEVAEYERSRDFRERFSEEITGDIGASSPSGRGNSHGSQETPMSVP